MKRQVKRQKKKRNKKRNKSAYVDIGDYGMDAEEFNDWLCKELDKNPMPAPAHGTSPFGHRSSLRRALERLSFKEEGG